MDTDVTKVGITGAAGFIGSHLSQRLLEEGVAVVGLDDLSMGSLENLASVIENPLFSFVHQDCTVANELSDAFAGVDAIIHLAAKKIPRYSGALETLEQNVAGVNAAAHVALDLDADLIMASTSDVYGNAPLPFREDGPLTLGAPTTRRWAYAVSKLYDEHVLMALGEERGLRHTILRLFGSYGPRNHPTWWGGPQSAFIERLLDGEHIDIHGDGQQVRTFTYIDDTVDGFVRTLRTPAARGHIINVGGTTPSTILELAAAVHHALGIGLPLRARFMPYSALPGNYEDVRTRVPDISKAREILGFEARVSLAEGLDRSVAWHRERRVVPVAEALAS
jgi:UDP-glucose 4-epimerase